MRKLKKSDASVRYISWLRDNETKKYISAAKEARTLEDLERYISSKSTKPDVLFLGIFEKNTGTHIGNIKYEPIDSRLGYAVMGILIGDKDFRGKGVAVEVIAGTAEWLRAKRGVRWVLLGVNKENIPAIRAYEKLGFSIANFPYLPAPSESALYMVWDLSKLVDDELKTRS